jgi:hypothetical protein
LHSREEDEFDVIQHGAGNASPTPTNWERKVAKKTKEEDTFFR